MLLLRALRGREATTDIIVSPLADELGIAVESFGRGLWRFTWEPKEKLRESERT